MDNNIKIGDKEYRETLHRWSKLHGLHTHVNVLTPTQQREMEKLNRELHDVELGSALRWAGAVE